MPVPGPGWRSTTVLHDTIPSLSLRPALRCSGGRRYNGAAQLRAHLPPPPKAAAAPANKNPHPTPPKAGRKNAPKKMPPITKCLPNGPSEREKNK